MGEMIAPKGLAGVVVDKTAIAITDSEGVLLYRGYRAVELAEKAHFEDAAFLIVNGKLPSKAEKEAFIAKLKSGFGISEDINRVISILKEKDMMRALRSLVSMYPYKSKNPDDLMLEMASKFPELISNAFRLSHGMQPLNPIEGTYAERIYYLLTGKNDQKKARYLEELMILYMEHEFNASTFALRVTASTLADPVSAFTTALATLKGPLHGGANAEILEFFDGFRNVQEAIEYVDTQLEKGEKVMGFGHRVYKRLDPRAQFVKLKLRELAGDSKVVKIAEAIEQRMWEKKNVPANVDFFAALYMHLLGIQEDFFTPLFAASRVFGWCAHYKEQLSDNKIIRPDAQYVGPKGLQL